MLDGGSKEPRKSRLAMSHQRHFFLTFDFFLQNFTKKIPKCLKSNLPKNRLVHPELWGCHFWGFLDLAIFQNTHFFKRPREANQHSGSYDAQSRAEVLVRVRASISVERDFGDLPFFFPPPPPKKIENNFEVSKYLQFETMCTVCFVPILQPFWIFFNPPPHKKSNIILKLQNIYNLKQCALFDLSPYCNRVYRKPFPTVCTPIRCHTFVNIVRWRHGLFDGDMEMWNNKKNGNNKS